MSVALQTSTCQESPGGVQHDGLTGYTSDFPLSSFAGTAAAVSCPLSAPGTSSGGRGGPLCPLHMSQTLSRCFQDVGCTSPPAVAPDQEGPAQPADLPALCGPFQAMDLHVSADGCTPHPHHLTKLLRRRGMHVRTQGKQSLYMMYTCASCGCAASSMHNDNKTQSLCYFRLLLRDHSDW